MRLAYRIDKYKNTQAMVGQDVHNDVYAYMKVVIRMFTVMCNKYYTEDDIDFLLTTYINISEGRKTLLDEVSANLYRKRNGINIRSVKYRLTKHTKDMIIRKNEEQGTYSLHDFIMNAPSRKETRFEVYLEFFNE
jgi:hypothetical protein